MVDPQRPLRLDDGPFDREDAVSRLAKSGTTLVKNTPSLAPKENNTQQATTIEVD